MNNGTTCYNNCKLHYIASFYLQFRTTCNLKSHRAKHKSVIKH